ncbi:MAG: hypothetical protein Q9P90_13090 [candidate division KSB1 bacterium]|nr:hypothetical protein [candidate division KSB1 bacterium]
MIGCVFVASPLLAQIPRFAMPRSDANLASLPQANTFFDVIGRRAAVLGRQKGNFELWIFPFQIVRQFELQFQLADMPGPAELSRYVTRIETAPERTTLTYSHPLFLLKQHIFVPVDQPAVIQLLEIDAYSPFELYISFLPSLQPMWPAGMGGQYAFWSDEVRGYILSESRRKINAVIGSGLGQRRSSSPAHALSQRPNLYSISVHPDSVHSRFIPILITADFESRESCLARYDSLMQSIPQAYERTRLHYRRFLDRTLSLHGTPLDEALTWNKLAMHKGFICNPDLGCGLVAGFGPSGAGRRPGFAWFFGGDAFINSFAMTAYGDLEIVRQSFEFLIRYQRDDGKMPHEISQSAGLLDWFGDYPYGYIHGDTTPYFLAAVANYFRHTDDTVFVRRHAEAIRKAYRWCRSTDSDDDGLMENTRAGLGASELGSLREASGVDIFLAAIGVQAWQSTALLAQVLGDADLESDARRWFATGRKQLDRKFWNAEKGHYNFSLTRSGKPNPELTAWSSFPSTFDLLPEDRARRNLQQVASSRISTDWGSRMLSNDSPAYAPLAYNNGAVWPFLTGFVIQALFRQHHALAGTQALLNLARWISVDAPGVMPEVISGEYFRPLETSVPHQLFSSSGFVAGLLRGLLGLDIDAPNRTLTLRPHLPPDWDELEVRRIPLGRDHLSLKLRQTVDGFQVTLLETPQDDWTLLLQPAFGAFAHVREILPKMPVFEERTESDTHLYFKIRTKQVQKVQLTVDEPLRVWPYDELLEFGQPNRQMKVVSVQRIGDRTLELVLEAPAGSRKWLRFAATGAVAAEGADIQDGRFLIDFRGDNTHFVRKRIRVKWMERSNSF